MRHFRKTALLKTALALFALFSVFSTTAPARANVNTILLGRRTCETIVAFVLYDGFSAGSPFYLAAFTVDLDGNGVFGESTANERTIFTRLKNGTAGYVKATLKFPAVPEGTQIAVTGYEIDSSGRTTSAQLSPVRYTCTNRPQTRQIPADAPFIIPNVAVTVKVTRLEAIPVWSGPDAKEKVGGLAVGAVVTAIGRNSRGDWLEVIYGGGTAWLMWATDAIVLGPYKSLPVTAQ